MRCCPSKNMDCIRCRVDRGPLPSLRAVPRLRGHSPQRVGHRLHQAVGPGEAHQVALGVLDAQQVARRAVVIEGRIPPQSVLDLFDLVERRLVQHRRQRAVAIIGKG